MVIRQNQFDRFFINYIQRNCFVICQMTLFLKKKINCITKINLYYSSFFFSLDIIEVIYNPIQLAKLLQQKFTIVNIGTIA